MIIENKTLTEKMRDEMFKYAVEVINEDSFSENNWTKLHEKDRFFNWYRGYTEIKSPYNTDYGGVNIKLYTCATLNFGEKYQPELVEKKLSYRVYIYRPDFVQGNENVTLNFKVGKMSLSGLGMDSDTRFFINNN